MLWRSKRQPSRDEEDYINTALPFDISSVFTLVSHHQLSPSFPKD